jgi:hypothetical protein
MPSIPRPDRRLSDRQRGALALVVGTVLVLNPLYITALHVDGGYHYRTAPATVEGGQLIIEGVDDSVADGIANLGCADELEQTRACAMDRYIHENGPVSAPRSDSYNLGNQEYVRVDGDYYQRVERERNGTVLLALERTSARETLEEIAVPRFALTWPGRILLFTGRVTTTYPLEHDGYIVRSEEGY